MISSKDREYLRSLAKKVKEISDNDIFLEKIDLWKKLNKLQSKRPMVLCAITDELWPELITKKELLLEDPFYRHFEFEFKKLIYRWNKIRDDSVTTDKVYIPIDYEFTDWLEGRRRPYAAGNPYESDGKTSESFHPCVLELSDWKKIRKPELKYVDWKNTQERVDKASDVFGDILDVVKGQPFMGSTDTIPKGWGLSMIDILCELRGLEQIYMDMILNPGFVHEAMDFLTDGLSGYLDTLEKENLLTLNNNEFWQSTNTPLGANGLAITDELPGKDYDPNHVTAKNLWGFFQAQEFAPVSPEMQDEFVIKYQKRIAPRFPLISYGCCEKYDHKYDYLFNAFPNLREVSVCHEANLEIAAEKLQDKYVTSWKPHCTIIYNFNKTKLKTFMKKGFETLKECNMVCSLHDNLSLFGENDAIERWTDVTMEIAEQYNK